MEHAKNVTHQCNVSICFDTSQRFYMYNLYMHADVSVFFCFDKSYMYKLYMYNLCMLMPAVWKMGRGKWSKVQ